MKTAQGEKNPTDGLLKFTDMCFCFLGGQFVEDKAPYLFMLIFYFLNCIDLRFLTSPKKNKTNSQSSR